MKRTCYIFTVSDLTVSDRVLHADARPSDIIEGRPIPEGFRARDVLACVVFQSNFWGVLTSTSKVAESSFDRFLCLSSAPPAFVLFRSGRKKQTAVQTSVGGDGS